MSGVKLSVVPNPRTVAPYIPVKYTFMLYNLSWYNQGWYTLVRYILEWLAMTWYTLVRYLVVGVR